MTAPYHYLIVDDDSVTSTMLRDFLSRQGAAAIQTADNGKSAMHLLAAASNFPDIIICDLNMPDVDGVELVQYLAQEHFIGGLVLISGTAQSMLHAVRRLGQAHFINILGVLSKPFKPEALMECIGKYDRGYRASTA